MEINSDHKGFESKRDKKLDSPSIKKSRGDLEDNGTACSSSYFDKERRTVKKHRERLSKRARRRRTGDDRSSESDSSYARKKRRRKTKQRLRNEDKRSERKETSSCSYNLGGENIHKRQNKDNYNTSCTHDETKSRDITVSQSFSSAHCNESPLNTAGINSISQSIDDNQDNSKQRLNLEKSLKMKPMTKEQYEMQQAVVREVYDPETNRIRLVRGSGEIIERIVRRQEHLSINQVATIGDGRSFTRGIAAVLTKSSKGAAKNGNALG